MSRVSSLYSIYDNITKQSIIEKAGIKDVVKIIGIRYEKVSLYAGNGYKYKGRYSIMMEEEIPQELKDKFDAVCEWLRSGTNSERLKSIRIAKKVRKWKG
jgi:uncharacterized protein YebE (UPF0316 family)